MHSFSTIASVIYMNNKFKITILMVNSQVAIHFQSTEPNFTRLNLVQWHTIAKSRVRLTVMKCENHVKLMVLTHQNTFLAKLNKWQVTQKSKKF